MIRGTLMKNKSLNVAVTGFKMDNNTGEFTCYGNIKGNIDHARDRTLDGAYQKSIEQHMKNGTMPKMFWMHNAHSIPVGKWIEMREDEKGLFMRGKLFTKSPEAIAIHEAASEGALDSFSIGYIEVDSKYNSSHGCNDLIELDIKEVSWVTFACNEASLLQSIKSHMDDGELPSKAELRELFKTTGWFSKRQVERITSAYNPADDNSEGEIKALLEKSVLFN